VQLVGLGFQRQDPAGQEPQRVDDRALDLAGVLARIGELSAAAFAAGERRIGWSPQDFDKQDPGVIDRDTESKDELPQGLVKTAASTGQHRHAGDDHRHG
jgi:hypothetical protein